MIIKYKDGYITGYEDNFNSSIVGYRKGNSVDITDKPKGVKGIKADAFKNCDLLTDFVIPDGITEIPEEAFRGCTNLESVTLPNGLKVMKKGLFFNCFKLKKVVIPESVVEIENVVFFNSRIENIWIPDSVKKIGTEVFSGCSHLTNIKLPNQLQTISASMFRNCENLEIINIPDTVSKIDEYAFYMCLNLKEVILPENLKIIDFFAFCSCEQLEHIQLPSKLVTIGRYSFNGCTSLQYMKIPETVKVIGESAFARCSNLVVEIPDNFQGYIANAFYGCKEIRFKSYDVFKQLSDVEKKIGFMSVIRNYFQDKTYYSNEEMENFIKFLLSMICNMKNIVEYINDNKEVIDFMFEVNKYTAVKGFKDLIGFTNKKNDTETTGFLLDYLHKRLESMGTTEADYTRDNELILEKYTLEELEEMNNKNNDDEDGLKQGL